MEEELKKEAEKFIIERYEINKNYRVDTEETRRYMSIDVHNDYEEEYQCYLEGLKAKLKDSYTWEDMDKSFWEGFGTARYKMEKRIVALEEQNKNLQVMLQVEREIKVNADYLKKVTELEAEIEELKENLAYAKAIMRELLDNSNEYTKQNAENFIKK